MGSLTVTELSVLITGAILVFLFIASTILGFFSMDPAEEDAVFFSIFISSIILFDWLVGLGVAFFITSLHRQVQTR